jgi:hypothetical protein
MITIKKIDIMFRKIHIAVVLFFVTSAAFGQVFRFGILFDPTITWLRSDVKDVIRDKARMGFDIGMTADYFFSRNYAFKSGVSLFNMGGTIKYNNDFTLPTKDEKVPVKAGGKVKYMVQYIKIPVAMKFKTSEIGRITYSANLGLDPMIRVSTRVNYYDEKEESIVKRVKANNATKLFNLGVHFGGGAQYSLGGDASLFAGLSFMNTFIDMTKSSHDRITSNNLVFRIGVMF